ncbi:MAG TPA: hypothetical protein V6D15_00130 [Oculatellaceae cyanobacterium]
MLIHSGLYKLTMPQGRTISAPTVIYRKHILSKDNLESCQHPRRSHIMIKND